MKNKTIIKHDSVLRCESICSLYLLASIQSLLSAERWPKVIICYWDVINEKKDQAENWKKNMIKLYIKEVTKCELDINKAAEYKLS